jgi:hypothetical protein
MQILGAAVGATAGVEDDGLCRDQIRHKLATDPNGPKEAIEENCGLQRISHLWQK